MLISIFKATISSFNLHSKFSSITFLIIGRERILFFYLSSDPVLKSDLLISQQHSIKACMESGDHQNFICIKYLLIFFSFMNTGVILYYYRALSWVFEDVIFDVMDVIEEIEKIFRVISAVIGSNPIYFVGWECNYEA